MGIEQAGQGLTCQKENQEIGPKVSALTDTVPLFF